MTAHDSAPTDFPVLTYSGDAAILTLNRPFAIDSAGKAALTQMVEKLDLARARALIITASHPQAFLVNVAELATMNAADARAFSQAGHRLANALTTLSIPVIAAVDGPALGGGCELVLACDIAIASDRASFGQIEALGGVMPGFGGTWRLPSRVGHQRASEMLFTAAVIDAPTALAYGLVLEVVPAAKLLDDALALATRIGKTSKASVTAIKRVMNEGWGQPPSASDSLEEASFPALFGPEQQARMHAYLENAAKGAV
jgi:enoyl-CoA hydratase